MSRRRFWNWLGLPSFEDIQDLRESAQRQEDALASLAKENAEMNRVLALIRADLSASVDRVNASNRNMLETAEKNICETLQSGIDSSCHLLSGQMSDFVQETLSTIQSDLSTSAEQMNRANEQINRANQETAAGVEERIRDTVQACAEKAEQLMSGHIQTLTEHTLAAAKDELNAALKQVGEENKDAVDATEQRICAAMHTYNEGSRQILSEQADQTAKSLTALSSFCNTMYGLDKDTRERIEHIITECETQNELMRMLLANTLIDDVSHKLSPEKKSRDSIVRNFHRDIE